MGTGQEIADAYSFIGPFGLGAIDNCNETYWII